MFPVAHSSYSTAPNENRSLRGRPVPCPWACSGDIYAHRGPSGRPPDWSDVCSSIVGHRRPTSCGLLPPHPRPVCPVTLGQARESRIFACPPLRVHEDIRRFLMSAGDTIPFRVAPHPGASANRNGPAPASYPDPLGRLADHMFIFILASTRPGTPMAIKSLPVRSSIS